METSKYTGLNKRVVSHTVPQRWAGHLGLARDRHALWV